MSINRETVHTKKEYIRLLPRATEAEYERLKRSIKEEGRLLLPVVLNQDNVVLDGHHRLHACEELDIPAYYCRKDFKGKPLEELMYVVSVNLYRRNLNLFQRVEVGVKVDEIRRRIAQERQQASRFTSETGQDAVWRRDHLYEGKDDGASDINDPSGSREPDRSDEVEHRVSKEMADMVGVSRTTYDRARYILANAPEETIEALRRGDTDGDKPLGIRSVYEQLRHEKFQKSLKTESGYDDTVPPPSKPKPEPIPATPQPLTRKPRTGELLHLVNKDFRVAEDKFVPPSSADLVLAFKFPDPIPEDELGKIHEDLMSWASSRLKEGGLLAMHVEEELLPRVISSKPSSLQFCRIIVALQRTKTHAGGMIISYMSLDNEEGDFRRREEWRPFLVLVKGPKDVQPLVSNIMGLIFTNGTREELIDSLLLGLSQQNGVVVDPFMNKGLVGKVALKVGRKYIGIERDSRLYLYALDQLQVASCSTNLRSVTGGILAEV